MLYLCHGGKPMAQKKNKTKQKIKVDKKEIIVTTIVLIAAIILGFIAGKALFDALY